jgi:hypothetical protein
MFSRTSRRQPGGAVAWKMKPPYDWFKPALRHSAPHRRDRSRSDRLLPNENGGFGCCKPGPPFTGYKSELPGAFPKIAAAELPKPYATRSVDNGPSLVRRPADAWPKASPARSRCSAELPTGTSNPSPSYVYVGKADSVVRFAYQYQNGDLKARGPREVIVPVLPGGGRFRFQLQVFSVVPSSRPRMVPETSPYAPAKK